MGSMHRQENPEAESPINRAETLCEEPESANVSIVELTAKLARRDAALLEARRHADELAGALDKTQSELAAARARLEEAEETIAAVNEIAEAAQATIDRLRKEVVGAEAQASQGTLDSPQIAAEPHPGFRLRASLRSKIRDHLGRKLISGLLSSSSLRIPRWSFKRAKPSLITSADRARDVGQWEIAARHYRKALNRNPLNSPIWVQYGHTLKETGRLLEAERAYRKAIELDPNAADSHLQLGHVLKLQRRRNEAVAAYLRALDLDPTLRDASLELVALGWTRGRYEQIARSRHQYLSV
jgi:tetratricopeptide (TPR) repeat protein